MAVINKEELQKINKQLEGVTQSLDMLFERLEKEAKFVGKYAQKEIDKVGEEVSIELQEKVNGIRTKTIKTFSEQTQVIKEKIKPIEPLLNVNLSIDTVVSVVKSIIDIMIAPYEPYVEYIKEIMPEILKISDNPQEIANYKPEINLPDGLEPPKINVTVEPITAKEILG